MTIFDIDEAILNLVDEETGEVVDIEALEALEMERDRKVSNIACWIKQLDAEAEAIKAEKKKLADRQTAKENKSKALRLLKQLTRRLSKRLSRRGTHTKAFSWFRTHQYKLSDR